jgi:hypothetical protein
MEHLPGILLLDWTPETADDILVVIIYTEVIGSPAAIMFNHDYLSQHHYDIEFPQSQARASEVIPTQVLQGTRKKCVR